MKNVSTWFSSNHVPFTQNTETSEFWWSLYSGKGERIPMKTVFISIGTVSLNGHSMDSGYEFGEIHIVESNF